VQSKRLFCLKVKPLYTEHKDAHYWGRNTPLPLFCHVHFDEELIRDIHGCRELLVSHGLSSIAKRCSKVSCFFEITERFHMDATIELNVTETEVFFTGFIPPFKEAYFKSSRLPIALVIDSAEKFKRVDHVRSPQTDQEALIKQIELKHKEQELLWDEQEQLDSLKEQIEKLEASQIDFSNESLLHYQQELSDKISKQQVKVDDVEVEIEALCKQLLWRYFKILPGDWIYADFDGYKDSPTQLVVESVSFHDKFIHIFH